MAQNLRNPIQAVSFPYPAHCCAPLVSSLEEELAVQITSPETTRSEAAAPPRWWERFVNEALSIHYKIRSDEDLVNLARCGNDSAFDELTHRYRDRIYSLTFLSLGDEEAAGDALCDTFVSAYRGLGSIEKGCSPRTWLYLHAVRAVFTRLRERSAPA